MEKIIILQKFLWLSSRTNFILQLREIKLRQQNWLREREATIKDEPASSNNGNETEISNKMAIKLLI